MEIIGKTYKIISYIAIILMLCLINFNNFKNNRFYR